MPDVDPALTGSPSTDPDRTKKSDYDAQLNPAEVEVVEEADEEVVEDPEPEQHHDEDPDEDPDA